MNHSSTSSEGNTPETQNNFSPIAQALLWCSGANLDILARCPGDVNKFIGIGGAVLTTGILAMVSGGFAIRTIASSPVITLAFAVFWGLIIFNLDRFILASMRKGQNKGKEFRLALPRMVLAVAISVIVSKPLEIEIARNQINAHLETTTNQRLTTDRNQKAARLDSMTVQLDSLEKKADRTRKELANGPESSSIYADQKNITAIAKENYSSVNATSNAELAALNSEREALNAKYPNVSLDLWANGDRERLYRLKNASEAERQKIRDARATWENEQQELDKIVEDFQSVSAIRIENFQQQIDILKPQVATEKIKVDSAVGSAADLVIAYRQGFLAELEALDQLANDPEHPSIWWASMGIMLLIILLELSPVMVKLMLPRGLYDECLDAEEIRLMNQARSDANAAIMIYNSRNETNVASSTTQTRAIRNAIQRWDADEALQQDNRYDLRAYLGTVVDNLDSHLQPANPENVIESLRRPPSMVRKGWVWVIKNRIFHFVIAGLVIAGLILGLIILGKWIFEEEPALPAKPTHEIPQILTEEKQPTPDESQIVPVPSEEITSIQTKSAENDPRSNKGGRQPAGPRPSGVEKPFTPPIKEDETSATIKSNEPSPDKTGKETAGEQEANKNETDLGEPQETPSATDQDTPLSTEESIKPATGEPDKPSNGNKNDKVKRSKKPAKPTTDPSEGKK